LNQIIHALLVVALIVGIIAGPLVSNGFDPNSWDDHSEITKELTRCILAIQVNIILIYNIIFLLFHIYMEIRAIKLPFFFFVIGNGSRHRPSKVNLHFFSFFSCNYKYLTAFTL
jgi:hypothetical protein